MYRIIDERASGKTSRLMLLAKEKGATIVCANPEAMQNKSYKYGIVGIDFISYGQFYNNEYKYRHTPILIDELENFVSYITGESLAGYTLSKN